MGKRSRFSGLLTIVGEGLVSVSESGWASAWRPQKVCLETKEKDGSVVSEKRGKNNTGFCLNKNSFLKKLILLCSKSKPELRRSQVLRLTFCSVSGMHT